MSMTPKRKVGSWNVAAEFEVRNLASEQTEHACTIINENKERGWREVLDMLAHAGFRGTVVDRIQLNLPLLIVIDYKVEIDKQ